MRLMVFKLPCRMNVSRSLPKCERPYQNYNRTTIHNHSHGRRSEEGGDTGQKGQAGGAEASASTARTGNAYQETERRPFRRRPYTDSEPRPATTRHREAAYGCI